MNRKIRLRVGMVLVILVSLVYVPISSFAATATTSYQRPMTPDVFVTELQTASMASGGEEFVELYNSTDNDIDFSDVAHNGKNAWKLQYFTGSKLTGLLGTENWASPTRTINLTGIIPAHDYYVAAAGTYQPGNLSPEQTYSSTLADDSGAVQLIDSSTSGTNTTVTIHNQLAWSNDKTLPASTLLFASPGAGASLQRLPNADTQYVDDSGKLTGFTVSTVISPDNAWVQPAPVDPTPPAPGDGTGSTDASNPPGPTAQNSGLDTPVISEVLPNPASPQTDEHDEFIELFNPNDTDFNLNEYTLQTGETTLHNFTFTTDVLLEPHGYRAFYSADTGLSLSNTGGQARLLDPQQNILNESAQYGTAAEGQAWARNDTGGWSWTMQPTPNASNVILATSTAPKAVAKTASKTIKKTAGKVKGLTTTKKKAAAKVKKAKKKTAAKSGTQFASNASSPTPAPIHFTVLVAVAALAVGYMIYEYRKDLANIIYKFRANRTARRAARSAATGR